MQDEITTKSGIKLFLDSSYNKEQNVSVTATIVDLPLKSYNSKEERILDQLEIGNEVAISYQVVSDLSFQGDGKQFMSTLEEDDYVKEFANGRGEKLRMYALKKRSGFGATWVGILQDKRNELIDGIQGTESEVQRWMAQFPIGKIDIYTFNNLFSYNGRDYWKCLPTDIFGKRVKGELQAVNDRVVCKPIEQKIPKDLLPNVQHNKDIKIRFQDRAKVVSSNKKGIEKGDVISFKPNVIERYEFWSKSYYLINEKQVLGKWH